MASNRNASVRTAAVSARRTGYATKRPTAYVNRNVASTALAQRRKTMIITKPIARKRVVIEGHGDYKVKKEDRSIGHKIGSGLGGFIGHGIQQLIKNITGFGDYQIESNSLMTDVMQPPQIVNTSDGGFILRHREYIKDIVGSIAFKNEVFPLNPGMSVTFPWLSLVANAFEEFEWLGVVGEFKSTSSETNVGGPTNALGTVAMATQYGAEETFTSKATMLNYEFANSSKPSCNFYHPVECKRDQTPVSRLYVRSGPVPVGQDPRLYDLGQFQIATEGQSADGGVLGELWMTWELKLFKPRANITPPINAILSDHFEIVGFSNANPFGTTTTPTSTSSLKGRTTNNAYLFPPGLQEGNFLIYIIWRGTTGVTIDYPNRSHQNSVIVDGMFQNNVESVSLSPPDSTVSAVNASMCWVCRITGPNAAFVLNGTIVLPGAPALPCDMYITQIDSDLVNFTEKQIMVSNQNKHDKEISEEAIRKFAAQRGWFSRSVL